MPTKKLTSTLCSYYQRPTLKPSYPWLPRARDGTVCPVPEESSHQCAWLDGRINGTTRDRPTTQAHHSTPPLHAAITRASVCFFFSKECVYPFVFLVFLLELTTISFPPLLRARLACLPAACTIIQAHLINPVNAKKTVTSNISIYIWSTK